MCTMKKETEALAALKAEIKALTKTAKNLETKILESKKPADSLKTKHGTLSMSARTTWNPIDNEDLINHFGIAEFRQVATVTCSNIKKFFGTNRVEEFRERGLLTVKSESKYYTLRG